MKFKRKETPSVNVQADIHLVGENINLGYGGRVCLKRIRGEPLVSLYVSSSFMGGGSVQVDPAKLRDALDALCNEDLGA